MSAERAPDTTEDAARPASPQPERPLFSTLAEISMALLLKDKRLTFVDGRTLPKGYSWSGHDIPGRGKAAKRRLKQMEKQSR